MPRECASCGVLKAPRVRECPSCGFTPSRQSEIEFEEGELVEVTKAAKAKVTMADKCDFHAQVLWIAKERNRSTGWAAHTYRDRFGVWPVGEAKHVQPKAPTAVVRDFVKSKDIRFAKRRAK